MGSTLGVGPDTGITDEALAARAAAGEHSAFEELVARYQDRVYRLAYRLTGNDEDAFDIVQQTLLQMLRHLSSFRGEARFGTWLYRICTNASLMHIRARRRRSEESLEAYLPQFDGTGTHRQTPEELVVAARIEDLIDRQRLVAHVQKAIARLPEHYRVPFVLRDLEELSTADVAQILEIQPAAVRQRVHRARMMLRGFLASLVESTPCH